MSLRNGKWTSYPNDEQIRREANSEYWKFICPKCGSGAGGSKPGKRISIHEEFNKKCGWYPITRIKCGMCGWEWFDPVYYIPFGPVQSILTEFIE